MVDYMCHVHGEPDEYKSSASRKDRKDRRIFSSRIPFVNNER